jgi:ketosteroid isomerase-like protein
LPHVQSADERAGDRAYIRQAESDWAESVVANDVSVLERILADDFVGELPWVRRHAAKLPKIRFSVGAASI